MTREEKNKLASRILAGILALLMIGGAAYYAIYLMAMSAKAQDSNTAANGTETVIMDTSSYITNQFKKIIIIFTRIIIIKP